MLEASAGTGKTFTIAALVARLVAEGVAPLSDILVVTFTRMATGELRDRVRERLVSAEAGLGRVPGRRGRAAPADDPVLELLAEGARSTSLRRAAAGGRPRELRHRHNHDDAWLLPHGPCGAGRLG